MVIGNQHPKKDCLHFKLCDICLPFLATFAMTANSAQLAPEETFQCQEERQEVA
jgi:hypothetical protein